MRLFWKFLCGMAAITALACGLGGYLLIDAQFRGGLEQEVAALYEENDLLRYAVTRELGEREESPAPGRLVALVNAVRVAADGRTMPFRLSREDGTVLADSGLPPHPEELVTQLTARQRGWTMERLGERRFLHAASPLRLGEETVYLENSREVTRLFLSRAERYGRYEWLLLALTILVGGLSLALTSVLLRPLGRLSRATRRIAAGELEVRVPVDTDDELGRLSEDFNTMAKRLSETVGELKEATRRQESFVGSFAHEIKTPLTSIIGYADLLRSRPLTPKQTRKSAGYIFDEGRRLEALSRKLMELIVLDKQDFSFYPLPMDRFLQQLGQTQAPILLGEGIRVTVRAEEALVPAEPDLLKTVLLNLMDNARKAMIPVPEGEHGDLLLEGSREEGGYRVRITDTGKGIPAAELGRITEAFYMVDKSRARAQGGAGLGLALCTRIVELHGGRMEIQSVEGKGTQVTVHLKGGTVDEAAE